MPTIPIHLHEFQVPTEVVDENGHVNNVVYVRWMQDAAVRHSDAVGCTQATRDVGALWVVRSHRIEYLRPAFAGDSIAVSTWIADFRRVISLRRYQFLRTTDQVVLACGETDWVFVDAKTGRPRAIPAEVRGRFEVLPDQPGTAKGSAAVVGCSGSP